MFRKILLSLAIVACSIVGAFSSSWELLGGTNGFSGEMGEWVDFGFLNQSTPIVVYSDRTNQFKTTLMYFTNAGNITNSAKFIKYGFSTNEANYVSLSVNESNNTAWITFSDRWQTFKGSLWAYTNGTSTNSVPFQVSNGFTSNIGQVFETRMDRNTNLVIVYQDYQNQNKASALLWNGATFSSIGTPGFSSNYAQDFSRIAINTNNNYAVAFSEYGRGNEISMYKYTNSGNWFKAVTTTNPGAMPSLQNYLGNFYLAYRDNIDWTVRVAKYTNAGSWYSYGTNKSLSAYRGDYPSIDVNSNGIFLAYKDFNIGNGMLAVRNYSFLAYLTNANTNIAVNTNTFVNTNAWTNALTNAEPYTVYASWVNTNVNALITNLVFSHVITDYMIFGGQYITNSNVIDGVSYPVTVNSTNGVTNKLGQFVVTNAWNLCVNSNQIFTLSNTNYSYPGASTETNNNNYLAGVGYFNGFNPLNMVSYGLTNQTNIITWTVTNTFTNLNWFTNITTNVDSNQYSWTNTVTNTTNGNNIYVNSYVNAETNIFSSNMFYSFATNDSLVSIWTNSTNRTYTPNTLNTTYNTIGFTNAVSVNNIYYWTNIYSTYLTVTNVNTNTNAVSTNLYVSDILINSVVNSNWYTNYYNPGSSNVTTNTWKNPNQWTTVGTIATLSNVAPNFVGVLKMKVTANSNVPYILFQDMPVQALKMIRYR